MSQRTQKVASLVHQTVAYQLATQLPKGDITVTGVDVSPDLRHATIWIGVLGSDRQQTFKQILALRDQLQSVVAKTMTTKFIPRLRLEFDTTGDYVANINSLLK